MEEELKIDAEKMCDIIEKDWNLPNESLSNYFNGNIIGGFVAILVGVGVASMVLDETAKSLRNN